MPNVRITLNPDAIITISNAEYIDLLRQGLIYSVEGGVPIDYPDFSPAQYAELGDPASPAGQALSATIANSPGAPAKMVQGGNFLRPTRVPTLAIDTEYPQTGKDLVPVWVDGSDVYAVPTQTGPYAYTDRSLWKSTDYGQTFVKKGVSPLPVAQGRFLKLADGTLLNGTSYTVGKILRSTNDGISWTEVHSLRAGMSLMAVQSWAQDADTGYVYYGEYYNDVTATDIRVWWSKDSGATWSTFYTFASSNTAEPERIKHVHSIQWDTVDRRIYILTGDTEAAAGIYRINAAGTGIEKVILNRDTGDQRARAIGMMFFATHIGWSADTAVTPYIMRMARTEIGKASPVAENVYHMSSSGYFSIRAANDGSRWLVTCSRFYAAIDDGVHVYSVEDNGATVYEIAAFTTDQAPGVQATLQPVGQPEKSGENVWLHSYNFEYDFAIRGRVLLGTVGIAKPPRAYIPPRAPDLPSNITEGEGNMPRWLATMSTSGSNGKFVGAVFVANRTETITKLSLNTVASPAQATPSLVRLCVYEVATNGAITLMAATANDTTLLSSAYQSYTRSLTTPWNKVAGKQYAMGVVTVSNGTAASLLGWQPAGGMAAATGSLGFPLFAASTAGNGLTDLPPDGVILQASASAPHLFAF